MIGIAWIFVLVKWVFAFVIKNMKILWEIRFFRTILIC